MIPISAHLETNALCFAHVCLCRIRSTCRSSLDREERESSQPLFHQCMRKELLAASVSSSCLSLYIHILQDTVTTLQFSPFTSVFSFSPSLISITNQCRFMGYSSICFLPQLCACQLLGSLFVSAFHIVYILHLCIIYCPPTILFVMTSPLLSPTCR